MIPDTKPFHCAQYQASIYTNFETLELCTIICINVHKLRQLEIRGCQSTNKPKYRREGPVQQYTVGTLFSKTKDLPVKDFADYASGCKHWSTSTSLFPLQVRISGMSSGINKLVLTSNYDARSFMSGTTTHFRMSICVAIIRANKNFLDQSRINLLSNAETIN